MDAVSSITVKCVQKEANHGGSSGIAHLGPMKVVHSSRSVSKRRTHRQQINGRDQKARSRFDGSTVALMSEMEPGLAGEKRLQWRSPRSNVGSIRWRQMGKRLAARYTWAHGQI